MSTVEVRKYFDGQIAVYTDSEETRRQLKELRSFVNESFYYYGSKLVGVDIFLDTARMTTDQRRKFKAQIKKA